MTAVAPQCSTCGKPFKWYARRHPDCERRAVLASLNAHGALSADVAEHFTAGWQPVNATPSLSRINGIGTTLLGTRDRGSNKTATVTQYFTFLWVPILPLTQYRVVILPDAYYSFLAERSPDLDDWKRAAKVWIVLLAIVGLWHLLFE